MTDNVKNEKSLKVPLTNMEELTATLVCCSYMWMNPDQHSVACMNEV